jgi:putative ABC transport system permease protein
VRSLKQILALLQMSLSGHTREPGPTLVIVIGTACVVGVLISMLAMGAGATQLAGRGARADRAFVVPGGEQGSSTPLTRDAVGIITNAPEIKRDTDGKPIASAAALAIAEGRAKRDDARVAMPIIGVQAKYFTLAPEMHLTAGRLFHPAVHELIVGKNRHREERGLEVGDRVRLRGDDWTVVGHFETGGMADNALLTDAETLMSAFKLGTFFNVHVMLTAPERFPDFKRSLESSPAFNVEVKHEKEYLEEQSKEIRKILDFVSYFVATLMGIGATVGGVNALYALVDGRRRQLATLSAIGFGSFAIICAVLIESLLLSLPGAAAGALIAWILFNGYSVSPVGLAFDLAVTPQVVALGIIWALCMGLIGGLLPALRAARVSVATALRGT